MKTSFTTDCQSCPPHRPRYDMAQNKCFHCHVTTPYYDTETNECTKCPNNQVVTVQKICAAQCPNSTKRKHPNGQIECLPKQK